jgi:hypothetical protein
VVAALKQEMEAARRQREQMIQHITARISGAAA